jgi:hypothetical protein
VSTQFVLAAIPFRAEPAVSTGQVIWVVFATGALLLLTFLVLARARKKGWLDRWQLRKASDDRGASRSSWTVESQRVSRNILVHTLERSGQVLVLVESRTGVSVTTYPSGSSSDDRAAS